MRKSKANNISIIDSDLRVDGTIASKGKLIIKGTVRGTIDGEEVVIAREGSVYSDAKVATMTVGGRFEGEVEVADELVILATGNCAGKVVCGDLIVESGGILNAEVTCRSAKGSAAAASSKKKSSVVQISAG